MAQWLKALTALSEDLGHFTKPTSYRSQLLLTPAPWVQCLLLAYADTECTWYTYMHSGTDTHTLNK